MSTSGRRAGGTAAPPAAPRSLADDLRARDDDELQALLRGRPDLVHPVPADLTGLAVRATTGPATARALDRLDLWTLQVTEVLAALPDPASRADVAAALPHVAPVAVDVALQRLRDLALTWGSAHEIHLVRGAREAFGPWPCGLAAHDPADDGIADLEVVLAEAPDAARDVLTRLAWGPPMGKVSGADRVVTPDSARTPIDWLLAHGLLEAHDGATVVLPRSVALGLRENRFLADPQPDPPRIDAAARTGRDPSLVDRTAGQHAFVAVRMVEDLLEGWSLAPPAELRSGGLSVRDLTATARSLDVDEATAALVVEVARAAGLLASDDEVAPVWLPTPAYDLWAARDIADRWLLLATTWLTSPRVPALVGSRDDKSARLNALTPEIDRLPAPDIRRLVLDVVAGLPPGVASQADEVRSVLDHRRPRRATALRELLVAATLREAEFLGVLGLGALSAPGRALLADDPVAAAAAVAPLLPSPLDHVLLQADLTAVAPGPLETGLSRELALMADIESTGAATVYRFTEASVRRALDAGRTASDVLSFLTERSTTPVPQPLSYLVDDVARRHGGIRVGMASAYVRCDDDATLAAIMAERKAAGMRPFRLAPTVIAVHVPVDEALDVLRSLGYAPMAESPDGVVVVRRPDARRPPPRPRPPKVSAEPPPPDALLLAAAVKALRAGDRVSGTPRRDGAGGPARLGRVPVSTTADTMAALRAALADERSLWVGYADSDGRATERVVDPVSIDRGFLTAYDHRYEEVRTFSLSRITGVAAVADDPA